MKFLKKYRKYISESLNLVDNILESMNISLNTLLSSIGAVEVNIYDTFKLSKSDFSISLDIDDVVTNSYFINSLSSIGLRISSIEDLNDYESFIHDYKFLSIYKMESSELENPEYILFQSYGDDKKLILYKVNGDMKRFYDKLSSKTIEITSDDENYIYKTSNSGNNWDLMNTKETDTFKRQLRKEDMISLLSNPDIKVNIV
jgi:hypothetical protein